MDIERQESQKLNIAISNIPCWVNASLNQVIDCPFHVFGIIGFYPVPTDGFKSANSFLS